MSGIFIMKHIIKQNVNKIAHKTYKPIHINLCLHMPACSYNTLADHSPSKSHRLKNPKT